jgi:hypothetical protein
MPTKQEVQEDTSSEDSSSSSSTASSDDESVDESSAIDEAELLDSIKQRQRLLSKLLQDKEGTEFAKLLYENEERVNSFLLESLRAQLQSQSDSSKPFAISSRANSSTQNNIHDNENVFQSIRQIITRELRFTIPGIIALITHCSLYLSIYGCLNKLAEWICDKAIIYLFGWHIHENAFDCSKHEQIFHLGGLLVACCLARLTGSIWAWNDNEAFQQRLKSDFKSRSRSSWDVRTIHWFEGRGAYKRNKWGPRWKFFLDIFSFFLAYIAVDKIIVHDFASYVLDRRSVILEGMPSRQLKLNAVVDEHGVINQCSNIDSSNETCSKSVVQEEFISDVMNWIENRNRCRWIEKEPDDEEEEDESKFRPWGQHEEEWKQLLNEQDEKYLVEKVSYKTYYELVGDPSAQFVDPYLENVFFVALTVGGFGVLGLLGSPFLLI